MIHINGKYEYVNFRNKNRQYHRLNGAAFISTYNEVWYKNGIVYTPTQYIAKLEHENKNSLKSMTYEKQ
jgi:hypothetical protein